MAPQKLETDFWGVFIYGYARAVQTDGQTVVQSRPSELRRNRGPGFPAQFLRACAIGADKDLAEVVAVTKAGFSRDDFQGVAAALNHGACCLDA